MKLSVPIAGKIVGIDAKVSTDTELIDGKNYKLVKHSSGFRYLATEDAITKMIEQSQESNDAMDTLEDSLI
jgi:hypothetical protein